MSAGALLIRGAVGVGKSSVAMTVSELLGRARVPHGAIDIDWVSQGWPYLGEWNRGMRVRNVRALAAEYRAIGASRFVVAGVVEGRDEIDELAEALGIGVDAGAGAGVVVCRLTAPIDVIHDRLRRRDTGSSLQWHLDRAVVLHEQLDHDGLDDVVVDTAGQDHETVAREVLAAVGWTR